MKTPLPLIVLAMLAGCAPQASLESQAFAAQDGELELKAWLGDNRLCLEASLRPREQTSIHNVRLIDAAGHAVQADKVEDRTPCPPAPRFGVGVGYGGGAWPYRGRGWPYGRGWADDYYDEQYCAGPRTDVHYCWPDTAARRQITEGATLEVSLLTIQTEQVRVTTLRYSMRPAETTSHGVRQVTLRPEGAPSRRRIRT